MGILRGITPAQVSPLLQTIINSGLKTIEITMNTDGAAGIIRQFVRDARGAVTIGAGTVLTCAEVDAACEAGATFIVMPVCIPEVVAHCVDRNVPVFPGALTPQEIYTAYAAGATMVKVFPAKTFGPAYIKELRGPFPQIPLLACGGISPDTIQSFFAAGASAAAFGGSIFKKEWLESGAMDRIAAAIEGLIAALQRQ